MPVTINGTTGIAGVDGSAGTPAVQGADSNTGIFFPAADTIAFAEGGAEVARFDSSGNFGIGVTPSAWVSNFKAFQVGTGGTFYGDYNNTTSYFGNNAYFNGTNWKYVSSSYALYAYQDRSAGKHVWAVAASGTAGNNITWTEAMTLDSSGRFGLGVSPSYPIQATLANASDWFAFFTNSSGTAPYGLVMKYSGASPNGTASSFYLGSDSTATRFEVRSNGGIANYSGNNVNLSDRREKTNFAPAGSYLPKICAIPVQTFNYIDQNMEEDPGETLGVVAQDVQAVAPELVMESNWGTQDEPKMRLSIYQTDLQYALMKCIQELKAELDTAKARIAALEAA